MSIRVSQPAINLREKLTEIDTPPIGAHGSELMNSSSPKETFDLMRAGRKNMIVNGDMQIFQRTTNTSGKNSSGYFAADMWRHFLSGAGTWTLSQDTDVPEGQGFVNSYKLDCTTADTSIAAGDYLSVDQAIEGFNVQQLDYGLSSAKSITISFYVKSTTTGTYTLEIYLNDGDYFNSKTYTISSANTWERKTITFAGNTSNAIADDNTRGLTCNFWLSNGSNFEGGTFSDGTWHNTTNKRVHSSQVNIASSTDNDWSVTGVQLEVSDYATEFEYLSYADELRRCQRYFERVGGELGYDAIANGMQRTTSQSLFQLSFKGPKRAAPTVTITGDVITTDRYAFDETITGLDAAIASKTGLHGRATHSSVGAERRPIFLSSKNGTPYGYISFDAEL